MAHSIGKTIAELRKAKGWTQLELAEKLNVSDKTVSKWENAGGFPEITQLPVLAALFDVSIDFLMAGKSAEAQIIAMSRAEMCAKNDDVTMLTSIDPSKKDEDGKTLSDYVYQYESVRVFNACENLKLKPLEAIKMALIANNLERLSGIKKLAHINDRKKIPARSASSMADSMAVLTDEIFELIVSDDRVTDETFDYLLQPVDPKENNVWYWGIPHLITLCYKKGLAAKLEKLLVAAEANNQYAFALSPRGSHSYNAVKLENMEFGIVIIPKEVFELALANSDIAMVERFNRINSQEFPLSAETRYVANDDEIRIAKLRLDKTISKDEFTIQSAIREGILCIDEILSTKDYKLIERALENYPITPFELKCDAICSLISKVEEGNWRAVFYYAVDMEYRELKKAIISREKDVCKKLLAAQLETSDVFAFPKIAEGNAKHLKPRSAEDFDRGYQGKLEYIAACKKQILADCASLYDKEAIVSEISQTYLEELLAKNDTEMLIIKLCVRLEAVLKSDYHLEGELSEMIERYCAKYGSERDEEGYPVEADFVKHLHKLRKCRNGIVHSEKTKDVMTMDELRFCIDYICKMGRQQ